MRRPSCILLFLVGNGYSIGPQFFRSLKGEGVRYLALAVLSDASPGWLGAGGDRPYASTWMLVMAAGLLSGALTQSPAIGTASETINALPLPQVQRDAAGGPCGDWGCPHATCLARPARSGSSA